jgi:hypothetical protein
MIEHHPCWYRTSLVEARDKGGDAVNSIETQPPRQLTVASDNQDRGHRFRSGRAQCHRTPFQTIQVPRRAPRRLSDPRFARFPQSQTTNPRYRPPAAIGQLQLRQGFALATALHRRTHTQLPRTGREQRHLQPRERQQHQTDR